MPELERQDVVCPHCDGFGSLMRDPYGNKLPCSQCGGIGKKPVWRAIDEVLHPRALTPEKKD